MSFLSRPLPATGTSLPLPGTIAGSGAEMEDRVWGSHGSGGKEGARQNGGFPSVYLKTEYRFVCTNVHVFTWNVHMRKPDPRSRAGWGAGRGVPPLSQRPGRREAGRGSGTRPRDSGRVSLGAPGRNRPHLNSASTQRHRQGSPEVVAPRPWGQRQYCPQQLTLYPGPHPLSPTTKPGTLGTQSQQLPAGHRPLWTQLRKQEPRGPRADPAPKVTTQVDALQPHQLQVPPREATWALMPKNEPPSDPQEVSPGVWAVPGSHTNWPHLKWK